MRKAILFATAVSLLTTACDRAADEADRALAFENVAVVAMDAPRVLAEHTVLIEGDSIAAVGPTGSIDVPAGARRVDGRGHFLMPGLAEMHAHLPTEDDPPGVRDAVLTLFVSQGVTFARGMLGGPDHPRLRDQIAAGERFGPTLLVASPFLSDRIEDPEEARALVQHYREQGFDLLKIGEGLTPEVYDAIQDEALVADIPFAGHVPDAVGLLDALAAGQRTIDHLDNYVEALRGDRAPEEFAPIFGADELVPYADHERIADLVDATLEARAAVVPTMLLWSRFFGDDLTEDLYAATPETRYLPQEMVAGWAELMQRIRGQVDPDLGRALLELRIEILRALHAGGVYVLLGSDAPQAFNVPGFSVHTEMRYLQDEVGLPPYEILFSGTRAVAEHLGTPEAFGTVQPGRRADLLLVRGNPLEDVGHAAEIEGVVLRGSWLPRSELDNRLEALEAQFQRP